MSRSRTRLDPVLDAYRALAGGPGTLKDAIREALVSGPPPAPPVTAPPAEGDADGNPDGTRAYQRLLEELSLLITPVVARRVLDASLRDIGSGPDLAATFELRSVLAEFLPGHLAPHLREDLVEVVLWNLELTLLEIHDPAKLPDTKSGPG